MQRIDILDHHMRDVKCGRLVVGLQGQMQFGPILLKNDEADRIAVFKDILEAEYTDVEVGARFMSATGSMAAIRPKRMACWAVSFMVVTTVAGSPCRTVAVHQSHGISGRKDGGTVPARDHYHRKLDQGKCRLTLLNAR